MVRPAAYTAVPAWLRRRLAGCALLAGWGCARLPGAACLWLSTAPPAYPLRWSRERRRLLEGGGLEGLRLRRPAGQRLQDNRPHGPTPSTGGGGRRLQADIGGVPSFEAEKNPSEQSCAWSVAVEASVCAVRHRQRRLLP